MEITTAYIMSQVFIIINYVLIAISYYMTNRKSVLIISSLSVITTGISYCLLGAYTGLAMSAVAFLRSIILVTDEMKNGKRERMTKKDIFIIILLFSLLIISAVFTYDGIFCLLSLLATMIYTFALCQKNTKVYKVLGIPTSIAGILYDVYIKSIFGIILESIVLIGSITGYILEIKRSNKT